VGAPYEVKLVKNALIMMEDGIELAADLYLPDDDGEFPAQLMYMPYHKDGYVGKLSSGIMGYFARQGYAGVIVDVRGTGSSDGYTTSALRAYPKIGQSRFITLSNPIALSG
jgi:predicted acyl esterase